MPEVPFLVAARLLTALVALSRLTVESAVPAPPRITRSVAVILFAVFCTTPSALVSRTSAAVRSALSVMFASVAVPSKSSPVSSTTLPDVVPAALTASVTVSVPLDVRTSIAPEVPVPSPDFTPVSVTLFEVTLPISSVVPPEVSVMYTPPLGEAAVSSAATVPTFVLIGLALAPIALPARSARFVALSVPEL